MRCIAIFFPLLQMGQGFLLTFHMRTLAASFGKSRPAVLYWLGYSYTMLQVLCAAAAAGIIATFLGSLRAAYPSWRAPGRWLWALVLLEGFVGWYVHALSHMSFFYHAVGNSTVDLAYHVYLTASHVCSATLLLWMMRSSYGITSPLLTTRLVALPMAAAAIATVFFEVFVQLLDPFNMTPAVAQDFDYVEGLTTDELETATWLVGRVQPWVDSAFAGIGVGVLVVIIDLAWRFTREEAAQQNLPSRMSVWVRVLCAAHAFPLATNWPHWRMHDTFVPPLRALGLSFGSIIAILDWTMHLPTMAGVVARIYYMSRLVHLDLKRPVETLGRGLKRFAFPGGAFPFIGIALFRFAEGAIVGLLPFYLNDGSSTVSFYISVADGPRIAIVIFLQYAGNMIGALVFGKLMAKKGFVLCYAILTGGYTLMFAVLMVPLPFAAFAATRFLGSLFFPPPICIAYIAKNYRAAFPAAKSSYVGLVTGLFWFNFGVAYGERATHSIEPSGSIAPQSDPFGLFAATSNEPLLLEVSDATASLVIYLGGNTLQLRVYSPWNVFFWPALIGLLISLATFVAFVLNRHYYLEKPKIGLPSGPTNAAPPQQLATSMSLALFCTRPILLNNLASILNGLMVSLYFTMIGPIMASLVQLDEYQYGWSIGAFSNTAAALLVANCGRLPRLVPAFSVLCCAALHLVVSVSLSVPAVYTLLSRSGMALYVVLFYGLGMFAMMTTNLAGEQWVADLAEQHCVHIGVLMGVNKFCMSLGQLIGPAIAFACASLPFEAPFWFSAGVALLSVIAMGVWGRGFWMQQFTKASAKPVATSTEAKTSRCADVAVNVAASTLATPTESQPPNSIAKPLSPPPSPAASTEGELSSAILHTVFFSFRQDDGSHAFEASLQRLADGFNALNGVVASVRPHRPSLLPTTPDEAGGYTHCELMVARDISALKTYLHSDAHIKQWIPHITPQLESILVFDNPLVLPNGFSLETLSQRMGGNAVVHSRVCTLDVAEGEEVAAGLADEVLGLGAALGVLAVFAPAGAMDAHGAFQPKAKLLALCDWPDKSHGSTHCLALIGAAPAVGSLINSAAFAAWSDTLDKLAADGTVPLALTSRFDANRFHPSHPEYTRGIHSVLGPPRDPKYHPLSCSRGREVATAWVPRPSDVMITTFPKTGTTWLQQVCHQLRNGGNGMDFMEVTQVMPWPEFAYECGQDLEEDAPYESNLRLFKTHLPLSSVHRGGRHLCITRDPAKTLLSWYAFEFGKKAPEVHAYSTVDAYANESDHFFSGRGIFGTSCFVFYSELMNCRHLPNVLVLAYELMLEDPKAHAAAIARFLGVDADDALLTKVVELSSRDYMLANDRCFDDSWIAQQQAELGRAANVMNPSPKVTDGTHQKKDLEPETMTRIRETWTRDVTLTTGLRDYKALIEVLRSEGLPDKSPSDVSA